MKRLLLFSLLIFSACHSQKQEIPKDILPVDSMKFVVWDMIQGGELAAIQYPAFKDSFNTKSRQLYQQILAAHGLDKNTFFKSFDYYSRHPDQNKILFDSISAYANRQRSGIYKEAK